MVIFHGKPLNNQMVDDAVSTLHIPRHHVLPGAAQCSLPVALCIWGALALDYFCKSSEEGGFSLRSVDAGVAVYI